MPIEKTAEISVPLFKSDDWKPLTPDSNLLVCESIIIMPVFPKSSLSLDLDNPATYKHPTRNSKTGKQGSLFASEIIDARMQYRYDHSPKPAKPRPMGWVR